MRKKLVGLILGTMMVMSGAAMAFAEQNALTFYGQAAFSLENDAARIIVDPYIGTSPWKAKTGIGMDNIGKLDLILVTHGHNDHIGDAVALSKRDDATIVAIA